MTYDAIVVGGGHNGLVCAAYLGRAGLRVLVLERRHLVGGACVTEEIFPGFRFSTTSYVCSLLRPEIVRDLHLRARGFELLPVATAFVPFPDGRSLLLGLGEREDGEQLARFSPRDAEAYPRYLHAIERLAAVVRPVLSAAPPGGLPSAADVGAYLRAARRFLQLSRAERGWLAKAITMSSGAFLSEWFESDEVKGAFAASGSIGVWGGPSTPGTAFVMLHYSLGDVTGTPGVWGFVRGGMGGLAEALAAAARSHGVEIRTEAPVERILVRDGRAAGVVLETGEEIEARLVASGVDPKRTFLGMLDRAELPVDFAEAVERIRFTGNSAKVNLALSELPDFTALPGDGPHLRGDLQIVGSGLADLDRAFEEYRAGRVSSEPYMDIVIPSTVDDTLAPPGRHVMSIAAKYVPFSPVDGEWTEASREAFADRVIETLGRYAPSLPGAVLHRQVLVPKDYEEIYGLTGGNIVHGDMATDQLFLMRPVYGWARYRTPIRDLYLCASGAHPGGGVMGAPGRNAAREIARDLRARRLLGRR